MSYVEFLRVRKAFSIYAVIVAVVVLFIVISFEVAKLRHGGAGFSITLDSEGSGGSTHVSDILSHRKTVIPLGLLLGLTAYFSVAFATVVASSLNRENERAGFIFTKPKSRERLALSYIAVDLIAIVAAYVYAFVVFCLVPLASLGFLHSIVVDPQALAIALLGLGVAFLWYGVLQAVTAGLHGRGGAFVGFSWLVFLVLSQLAGVTAFGPLFHGVVLLLNLVNPFAYFTAVTSSPQLGGDAVVSSIFDLSMTTRVAMTWSIAAVGCAIAIFAWKRIEV